MAATATKKRSKDILHRMHLKHRIFISLFIALLAFLLVFQTNLDRLVMAMIVWNAFAFSFIGTSWLVFFTRTSAQMRVRARQEDGNRVFVFTVILISSFASMFAVLLLVLSKDAGGTPRIIYVPVAVATMLFSWIMVHTTFCFHYAHLYYDDAEEDTEIFAGGLDFPNEKRPDYMDFVYFSFGVGMSFQVSDVDITSRTIRRLVLLHGLLAFGLNTFVVALTINLIAGLKH
ncbi:MAG: DUF1345 domain-containing protein [Bacteroidota bacterium]